MSVAFRRRRGSEGWRPGFSQELAKLDRLSGDSGTWGPKRPEPTVVGIASRIPEDVKPGKLPFSAVMITATSEGGIQIKWQDPRREFSIFIYPDSSLEYLFKDAQGHYQSGSLGDTHQVNECVDLVLA
jgi:hypothetical protein